MIDVKSSLNTLFFSAFTQLGAPGELGRVVDSQRPDLGQFQCNGAMQAARHLKQNPREIAKNVVDMVSCSDLIKECSIAGPGFINILLMEDSIADVMESVKREGVVVNSDKPEKTVIDFGGPNVAKPMHVGHLRSSIIGDSLARIMRFAGHSVVTDNHLGDWGTQMGMLISELERKNPSLPYFDKDYSGEYRDAPPVTLKDLEEMYPKASYECKKDKARMTQALDATEELQKGRPGYIALWRVFTELSKQALKQDFSKLGVEFDFWLGESFYANRMESLVKRLVSEGIAEKSEGAVIIPVQESSDKKKVPPALLQKSGGGYLYATSDIATIDYRVTEFHPDRIIYVVDKRQGLHFEQVFRAVKKASIADSSLQLIHAGFGTVNGPDGKPFKTREGGVMKLSDLISLVTKKAQERMAEAGLSDKLPEKELLDTSYKVGISALKYADLMNHRLSDYIFDIDKFTRFEGKTGPYLLYAAIRIKSILRNADQKGIERGRILPPGEREMELMLSILKFPSVIHLTIEEYAPNILCDYVYNLAQCFSRFYGNCHILQEEDKNIQGSWLSLVSICLDVMETSLNLLGIEVPERM